MSRTSTRDRFPAGTRIGDYVVASELHSESTGLCYLTKHVVLPRKAAVKVAHGDQKHHAIRMLREACLLEALSHPGIPRVYECGVLPDRRPWTALEHVAGESLDRSIGDIPLPVADVVVMIRDVADILDHIHQRGIVHHSIAPEAIVRAPARRFSVTLLHWSDAHTLDTAESDVDPTDDVHELGRIAFRALTGAKGQTGGKSTERYPNAPGDVASLVDQMMAGSRARRPSSAEVRDRAKWLADTLELVPVEPKRWTQPDVAPLAPDVEDVGEGFSIRISGRTRTR